MRDETIEGVIERIDFENDPVNVGNDLDNL